MRSLLLILLTSSVLLACEAQNTSSTNTEQTTKSEVKQSAENTIEFIDPWIRSVPAVSPNSAAYIEIRNGTQKAINLTGIQSQLADRIEIHGVETDDAGTMKMFEMDQIAIAPSESAELKPGGNHVMIFGLKQPLNLGEQVTMLLSFDNQPPMPVMFTVK